MDQVRFGILGCGLISKLHAQAIRGAARARLAGAWDVSPEAAKAFCAEHGGRAFESFEQMLESPEVDAVCVCTPSGFHADQAARALEHGKHVLVEKPMALRTQDADRLIALAERTGRKLSVVSQLRFSEGIVEAKRLIEGGALGRPVAGDVFMKYHRAPAYYAAGGWRGTKAHDGGGALMNQGIHGVDLLLHLMGPVKSVFAMGRTLVHRIEVEDTLSAVLEYRSGALGLIQATTSPLPGYPRRFELCGSEGSLMIEEDRILSRDLAGAPAEPICFRQAYSADPASIGTSGHQKQIEDFVRAIEEGGQPAIDGREGRRALRLIEAVYQSSEENRPVSIEEE